MKDNQESENLPEENSTKFEKNEAYEMFDILSEQLTRVEKNKAITIVFLVLQILYLLVSIPSFLVIFSLIPPIPYITLLSFGLWLFSTISMIILLVGKSKINPPHNKSLSTKSTVFIVVGNFLLSILSIVGSLLHLKELDDVENEIHQKLESLNKK